MGLQSFATFQSLMKNKHHPRKMGLSANTADINILANRMRIARSFRGINLDGYSDETKMGYDAFFQVFLTHAALERFCCIIGITDKKGKPLVYSERMVARTQPYAPEQVVQTFITQDTGDRLFTFIHDRLDSVSLQNEFRDCKEGTKNNVPAISAAIRHIFAHGHLTAHANGLNIKRVHHICTNVSDFILNFIDAEFTCCIDAYCEKVSFVKPSKKLVSVEQP